MARLKINELLVGRGITRYELAKQTGISLKLIYALAAAEEIPPKTYWRTLEKIRDALELEHVEDLLESN